MFRSIGNMFSSLWQGFSGLFRPSAAASSPPEYMALIRPGGRDRYAKEIKLQTRAQKDGISNIPSADSLEYGEVEARIIHHYERANEQLYQNTKASIEENNQSLAKSDLDLNLSTLAKNQNNAVAKLQTLTSTYRADLSNAFSNYRNINRHFDDFRKANRLGYRLPTEKSFLEQAAKVIFIVILAIMEIVLNGYFLGEGSYQGIVGGVSEAVSYSLINLVGTFFIWYLFVRNIIHVNWFRKIIGITALILWLIFIFVLNLGLAHFRELTVSYVENANAVALARAISDPFGLTKMNSWIVFAIGIIFACLAAIDAWFFVDPYPGFQRVFHQRQKARDEFDGVYSDALEDIQEVYEDEDAQLKSGLKEIQYENAHTLAIAKERSASLDEFSNHQDSLDHDLNALLKQYQRVNLQNRTADAPSYWEKSYRLPEYDLHEFRMDDRKLEELQSSLKRTQSKLESYVDELDNAYQRSREELEEFQREEMNQIRELEAHG